MKRKSRGKPRKARRADPERHGRRCTLCLDPRRQEIEAAIIRWEPIAATIRQFRLSRSALHRHIDALQLVEKRNRNIQAILTRVIEKGMTRLKKVSAKDVISAAACLAKLQGEWIDRSEVTTVYMNELFRKMSNAELETYISTGKLPEWVEVEMQEQKSRLGSEFLN